MIVFNCVIFLILQIGTNLLFKWGSIAPTHYWWGCIFGNLCCIGSLIFVIPMYRDLPAAAVLAIGSGGTFLLNQIAMFLIFREKLTVPAWIGVSLIFTGILMTTFLNGPAVAGNATTADNTITKTEKEN